MYLVLLTIFTTPSRFWICIKSLQQNSDVTGERFEIMGNCIMFLIPMFPKPYHRFVLFQAARRMCSQYRVWKQSLNYKLDESTWRDSQIVEQNGLVCHTIAFDWD